MAELSPDAFLSTLSSFPWENMFTWGSYSLGLTVYIILIWHFYRFVAKRDVFPHHLSFHHPGVVGFLEDLILGALRVVKYGIFFPIISFLWFFGFAVLLFVVVQNQTIHQITLIAIGLVGAARVLSYYNEELAQELAKLIPIVVLGIALVEPDFFSLELLHDRLASIPQLSVLLLPFIAYLSVLELGLRGALGIKHAIVGDPSKVASDK